MAGMGSSRLVCVGIGAALLLAGCRREAVVPDESRSGAPRGETTDDRPAIPAPAPPANRPGDPERRDGLFAQAERLAAFHDDARAIRKLEKALAAGPEDARTRRLLGLLKLRRDSDVAAARVELRRAAALDPTDAEPHLLLASLALELGDADAAGRHVADALRRDPDRDRARVLEARLLAQGGEVGAARARLDELIEAGAPAEAWFERGKLRLRGDDPEGALADFEAALRLAPTDTRIRFNLAQALRRLGRAEEAARAQEEFELLRPVFSLAKHDQEVDPRRRLERLRTICERFPNLWSAHVERARTELAVEGTGAARRTLEAARDAFPDEPEIRELLALLLDRLGESEAARHERDEGRRLREGRDA